MSGEPGLSAEERRRVALYLRHRAACNDGLLEQLKALPPAVGKVMGVRLTQEIASLRQVANLLDSIEDQTVELAGPDA